MSIDFKKLLEPFPPQDVDWRIGQAGKGSNGIWAKVLAYLTNRAIMDRLDSVVGPQNWRNEYTTGPQGGVLCGLSLRLDSEWVTKWDGAENTDIEAVKGGLSDAMKRAAVQWGIGRYLYDLGESWADVLDKKKDGARYANCKIKVNGQEEWVQFYWIPPRLPEWAMPTPITAPPASGAQSQAERVKQEKLKSLDATSKKNAAKKLDTTSVGNDDPKTAHSKYSEASTRILNWTGTPEQWPAFRDMASKRIDELLASGEITAEQKTSLVTMLVKRDEAFAQPAAA